MGTRSRIERDAVILACAVSAGIHGALVPEHLDESMRAGLGFAVATVLLAGLAVWLTLGAGSIELVAAAAVLAGLLASYGLAITTGLPPLHPEPEAVDTLALATKAVELVGLVAAAHLLLRARPVARPITPRTNGRPT